MKYSSTAIIPEAVADLLKDPESEEQLLGEILKHQRQRHFVATVGEKKISVSTVSPELDSVLEAAP